MKGIHPQLNGKWRVNIMVHRERMSKVCETYEQALYTARCIRYHLTLKHYGHAIKGKHAMNTMKEQATGNFAPITTINTPVIPQTFTFPMTGQGVRIVQKDGEPWFVAGDVCSLLGTDPKDVPAILEADEHCVLYTIEGRNNFSGLRKDTRMLTESGMYALVLKSRKPEARAFSKWVRSEVLPSIRRTGGYIMAAPSETPEILMARALFVAKDAIDRVNAQLAAAQPNRVLKKSKWTFSKRFSENTVSLNLRKNLLPLVAFFRSPALAGSTALFFNGLLRLKHMTPS